MKPVLRYFGHFLVVCIALLVIAIPIGLSQHASLAFEERREARTLAGEGPHIFTTDDGYVAQTIQGNADDGFYVESVEYPADSTIPVTVMFQGDGSVFSFDAGTAFVSPPSRYDDGEKVIAISDLEGNYAALRDFLLAQHVIDTSLSWQFGKGHLVLLGDVVDRGSATTQLLWLVYKLEQEARLAGGRVHVILGNHELKNLYGDFLAAADKYIPVAGILGKTRPQLFGEHSLLGQWLASKNIVEMINGYLFVHGGIHPEVAAQVSDLEATNQLLRQYYRTMYYPGVADEATSTLLSTKTGPAWYRGIAKEDLSESEVDRMLANVGSQAMVIGHTLQFSVNSKYNGKVFAIDVKHPNDYRATYPVPHSEGLLIDESRVPFRLLDDGTKEAL